MRNEKLRQIIYVGLTHSFAAAAQKYMVKYMSQETPCYSERIKEWPFIPSCRRKRIWLISQPTISVIYFSNTSFVCWGREGELFSSPGGAEHGRMRQHQRGASAHDGPMDTVLKLQLVAQEVHKTLHPSRKTQTQTHTLYCRAQVYKSRCNRRIQLWIIRSNDLMFNTFILYKHVWVKLLSTRQAMFSWIVKEIFF